MLMETFLYHSGLEEFQGQANQLPEVVNMITKWLIQFILIFEINNNSNDLIL